MYAFLADMTNPNPVIGLGLLPGVNVTLVYTPLMSYEIPDTRIPNTRILPF